MIQRAIRVTCTAVLTAIAMSGVGRAESLPVQAEAMGIGLESCPYPFPVEFLPLEIDGQTVRMAYMDVRPVAGGNGQTVVLLHGKNFYGNSWERTIRELNREGFRVVVPDQIGFGKSSKPDLHYSFDLLAANTARLLDALGVKQAAVVGHSTGGMLAVRFARTYPLRVTRLVLEDPVGLEDYRFKIPPQTLETLFKAELDQTPEKLRAFYARYFADPRPELYEREVELASRVLRSSEYPRWAKASALAYLMIYEQPVRHEFSLLKPPVLLVVGEKDRTVVMRQYADPEVVKTMGRYPELAEAAARDIPDCRLVVVPATGHVPHLERPDAFHRALLSFLGPTR
jgi:pimeloyl-ACP methyl ester carboxylesterase